MKNPWLQLSKSAPYVLESDRVQIEEFNKTSKPEHYIHLEVLPQPFAGSPETAEAYLLNLNPGFSSEDEYYQNSLTVFGATNLDSLKFKNRTGFFFLDERFNQTPTYKWWSKHLREVIGTMGQKETQKRLMVIEFFPYHSKSYKALKTILLSQEYSFYLVRQAIKMKKAIVIMRMEKLWLEFVPELKNYPYVSLINKQRAWVSKNNLPKGSFERVFKNGR